MRKLWPHLNLFGAFLQKQPPDENLEINVLIGTNWVQDAEIYEFMVSTTGDKSKAHYRFIYLFEDSQWDISHNHYLVMLNVITLTHAITEL